MPNRNPNVTSSNARKTGKDQGGIVVNYIDSLGRNRNARIVGPATRLAAPGGGAVVPQGTAGTTTYRYRVAAVDDEKGEGTATAGITTSTGNATLTATNFNRITWTAVATAASYRIYGRTGTDGTVGLLAEVTGTTYDDTGAATPGRTVPTFGTDAVRLLISTGPNRVYRNVVPLATTEDQTNAYTNR